jgi:4-diphosphocytidyl-2-C-methyl-D-erythritol kinase
VQVPTAAIFSSPDLMRDTPPIQASEWQLGFGGNDLAPVVAARYPAVAEHLAWLGASGEARMSGSGACVFAEFATRAQAEAVLAQLPKELRGWVAAGLDSHPLHALAR